MSRAGTAALIFTALCLLAIFVATLAALVTFPTQEKLPTVNPLLNSSYLVASPIDTYKSSATFPKLETDVKTSDSRPVIVDNFLTKHHSPMAGMGKTLVFVADKYGIDWKLLPAIAFQESNLGKKIPKGSYNAWGWAFYEGEASGVYFQSWASSIDKVAAKIKENYINNGFDTPETIVAKYTSGNSPSWVFAVNFAMEEISNLEY